MVNIIEITKAEDWPEEEDNDEGEDSDDDDEEDSGEDVEFISENGFVKLQNQVQGQMQDSQYPPYKFVFVNEPSDVPSFPFSFSIFSSRTQTRLWHVRLWICQKRCK
jgi:hypothetical protein